jgi:hypothetical protein
MTDRVDVRTREKGSRKRKDKRKKGVEIKEHLAEIGRKSKKRKDERVRSRN